MSLRFYMRSAAIPAAVFWMLGMALGTMGCGDDDGGGGTCQANLLPGDLVITEVMPNPDGSDDGKEWFEIYNATSAPIDLTGLTLVFSRADGSGRKSHVMTGGQIQPGAYFVLGGVLEIAKPDWVDYPYGSDLGSFTNSGGRLALECDQTLVDEVIYLEAQDGVSLGYDGNRTPDAISNDQLTDWCDATTEFQAGTLATPGAPNDACAGNPGDTCNDGTGDRPIVSPQAGDVVITEVMPNPDAAPDASAEWFEVYFDKAVDLNGLELGKTPGDVKMTVADATCMTVPAGSYVVFAKSDDSSVNGGLPQVDVVFTGFSLTNSGDSLFVGLGGSVLDQVSYSGSPTGATLSLDPGFLSATENDDATNWCDGKDAYGAGDLGTPGAANPSCGFVPPDSCIDAGTSQARSIVSPLAGDVVITEIMANPDQVGDTAGEWFEVYFAQDADLNGLQLGDASDPTHDVVQSADCLRVTAGSYVVFAKNADSGTNGGLPPVAYEFTFSLNNTNETVFVGLGGTVLDQVSYASSATGAAASLTGSVLSPVDNDTASNWCDAVDAYGGGDLGTPGMANPVCP